jgi:hypothetical protein
MGLNGDGGESVMIFRGVFAYFTNLKLKKDNEL